MFIHLLEFLYIGILFLLMCTFIQQCSNISPISAGEDEVRT